MLDTHQKFMTRCLELADIAKGKKKTAVGSLVVKNDMVIGEGWEGDPALPEQLSHAEVSAMLAAIKNAGARDLKGCTLYTTVEPCFMCTYLIRQLQIDKVVYGTSAAEIGGDTSAYPSLKAEDIKKWSEPPVILRGILSEACITALKR